MVEWPSSSTLEKIDSGMPLFETPVYFQQKAGWVKFGALVTPYAVDWDDDGDADIIAGNTAGYIGFIENLNGGNPPKWNQPKLLKADGKVIRIMAGDSGSIQGPAEKKWGYTTLSVADWDGDELKDVIVSSIWGKVVWFRNKGSKGFPQLEASIPIQVDWKSDTIPKPAWNWWDPGPQELATQWRTTPQAIDWNQDGMMDLVMLDYEGYLSFYEGFHEGKIHKLKPGIRIFYGINGSSFNRSNELANTQSGPLQLNRDAAGKSGRRKWCFTDWDQDGDQDILLNSINAALLEKCLVRDKILLTSFTGENLSQKNWQVIPPVPPRSDWNKDGIPDLLLGAEDGFLYYLPNDHDK